AAVWAVGRSRRQRSAACAAGVEYGRRAEDVPVHAARTERARLAAEVHDVAAHALTAVVVRIGAALRLADPTMSDEAIDHARRAGRDALTELDAITEALTTPRTLAAIDNLAAANPRIRFTRTVVTAPPEIAEIAYRVVREALTNCARYSADPRPRLRITADRDHLVVDVRDRGGPPTAPDLGTGSGLAGLRAAITAAGGTLGA
ncbi:histidine kinase, partial [Streptomyces sp. SID3343]|uniref:sensor histidine kinase n=1 Tax=Streptomyces sp. SID3343 TaxID=2690260 RepID=UPI0013BEE650